MKIPAVNRGKGRESAVSVREIQRMLLRVGYAPGSVDGLFGVRTRSAVQWFQIKHGFRPTGVVDLPTLDYLRSRSHRTAGRPIGARRVAPPARPADVGDPAPAVPRQAAGPREAPSPHGGGIELVLAVLVAALSVAALWLVTLAARCYPRLAAPRIAEAHPAAAPPDLPVPIAAVKPAPSTPPAQSQQPEQPRAIGYATGRDREELERHAVAIQRACSERGWSLSCLVRDGGAGQRRAGLAFAVKRMSEESAPRLVVGRLEDLGRSLGEVAAVLAWCARVGVALVALDVGLDTRTDNGRLAARCLLTLGNREGGTSGSRRRGHGTTTGSRAGAGPRSSARTGNGR